MALVTKPLVNAGCPKAVGRSHAIPHETVAPTRRDSRNGIKGDYLTYIGNVNQKAEGYTSAVGSQYVQMVTDQSNADIAWVTAEATQWETRMVAEATAEESYVHSVAAAQESKQVAVAQARRNLVANGDQAACDSAVKSVRDSYNTALATRVGDYRTAVATARRDYRQAVHGTGGAEEWSFSREPEEAASPDQSGLQVAQAQGRSTGTVRAGRQRPEACASQACVMGCIPGIPTRTPPARG
ncbi:MAG TPA: hypothetical protein EYH34_03415 [Planctomycetes bacterium]|nr:hypothetical protein [Planctomycetota bacterium]